MYDIDLDDAVWTPVDLVPYSVITPTVMSCLSYGHSFVADKTWVRVARIIIPASLLRLEHYLTGGCPASVHNPIGVFSL